MEEQTFLWEEPEPGIGVVTLNRPSVLNAINMAMLAAFEDLFARLARSAARVVIVTGAGRGFCAGADLAAVADPGASSAFADPETFLRLVQERYAALIQGLRNLPQPVIAAVNGPAAGGGFCLALAADIRFASPEAYFTASFINIGLSGGELGSSYLLPRLVGLSRAADILLTGRKVASAEAERIGLVSRVVPREELLAEAMACARVLLGKNPAGLTLTKRALERNSDADSLEAAMDLENRNQALLLFSGDFFERIRPFTGKTPPASA
jgi:enoyl-CoA hydratase